MRDGVERHEQRSHASSHDTEPKPTRAERSACHANARKRLLVFVRVFSLGRLLDDDECKQRAAAVHKRMASHPREKPPVPTLDPRQ